MAGKNGLTARQQRFVEEYIKDYNATQAYIRAGYSPQGAKGHASRMVASGNVMVAIEEAKAAALARVHIDQDYVLNGIRAEAEAYKATSGEKANPTASLKAYELLGKHLELFTEKVRAEVDHKYVARLPERAESAEDWLERLNGGGNGKTH